MAGAGAPLVAEFAVTEFAAAIGLSTDAGKRYVGNAVELRHRLPRLWRRVVAGDLVAWKARRVADQTLLLSHGGRGVRGPARRADARTRSARCSWRGWWTRRSPTFMPELAEERRLAKADGRHFTIETQQVSFDGTSLVHGELDLADAQDLDQAVSQLAAQLKDLGSEDSLDVRRAVAVGELARTQLALDLTTDDDAADRPRKGAARSGRSSSTSTSPKPRCPARPAPRGSSRAAIWSPPARSATGARRRQHRGEAGPRPRRPRPRRLSPEVPDRHRELVAVRDRTCVFPWCTRPARSCDTDHITPHSRGGPTCPCNEAPLCRRHHRIKTHGAWTYTAIEPGIYLWTSRHGYQYLRDRDGTQDVSHDRRDAGRAPD